jgi:predicted Kef-type K+ transport protein
MGFGLVTDEATITLIAEIGLILLLFIIGLEIDLKKLAASGRTLVVTGLSQFPLGVALGLGFFGLLGFSLGHGRFDALYLAVALALSSTMIVVKLLYDKFELTTLPGRITLGVLVFQDVWAILFLAVQPNLADPAWARCFGPSSRAGFWSRRPWPRASSCCPGCSRSSPRSRNAPGHGRVLVFPGQRRGRGRGPVPGDGGVGGRDQPVHLPLQRGRHRQGHQHPDFFVTLFFVGLGMQIRCPRPVFLGYAALASAFLVASRFASVFPVLYGLKNGLRPSLICSVNWPR